MPRSGPGSCPRCNRPLVVEVFQDVAEVLRCSECSGAFLPYASIGKIAAGTPAEVLHATSGDRPLATENEDADALDSPADPARSTDGEGQSAAHDGIWARLVKALRGAG